VQESIVSKFSPKDNPPLSLFKSCLFNEHPDWFKVDNSQCGGLGLWFNGCCYAGKLVVGCSGHLLPTNNSFQDYNSEYITALGGKIGFCYDASNLRELCSDDDPSDSTFMTLPLGHMVRTLSKDGRNNKCSKPRLSTFYDMNTGLLYLRAIENIDTCGKWCELFVCK